MSRVFLAVTASPGLSAQVQKFQQSHGALPVRWVEQNNLHFTIIPPWEASDTEIAKAITQLKHLRLKPVHITLNRIGTKFDSGSPRLIFAEGPATAEAERLWNTVQKAFGYSTNRPLWQHMTLARYRQASKPRHEIHSEILWQETLSNITLFESVLKPTGAEYLRLATVTLG